MQARLSWLGVALVATALASATSGASAQTALSGLVTSSEEGAMEGVLVSAKREGSTVTTTVVSDAQGHYSFPSSSLAPGRYSLRVRVTGYELDGAQTAEVKAETTSQLDLKLRKAEDLAAQLSNGEWLLRFPGITEQNQSLLS